jgi:GDP-4-dehydro-6-deoxy-D-mannose reductase
MKRPRALITGIAGFAGSYLAEELLADGFAVTGTILKNEPTTNLAEIKADVRLVTLDITDRSQCEKTIRRLKPDYIFHLAALSSVGQSFQNEELTFAVNFQGTLNLLRAAKQLSGLKRFLQIGSCEQYGPVGRLKGPILESQPFRPISPYAISKVAAEHVALYYYHRFDLPVIAVRAFNHSGPRQTESFVIPAFARQIARIEAGKQSPVLNVGDLTPRRDFSDVRDIVRGYRLLALKGKSGEPYQLCSGKGVTVRQVLAYLRQLSTRPIVVKLDRSRLRKADIPALLGSYHKVRAHTGWKPDYQLHETITDTLNYWRNQEGATITMNKRSDKGDRGYGSKSR